MGYLEEALEKARVEIGIVEIEYLTSKEMENIEVRFEDNYLESKHKDLPIAERFIDERFKQVADSLKIRAARTAVLIKKGYIEHDKTEEQDKPLEADSTVEVPCFWPIKKK